MDLLVLQLTMIFLEMGQAILPEVPRNDRNRGHPLLRDVITNEHTRETSPSGRLELRRTLQHSGNQATFKPKQSIDHNAFRAQRDSIGNSLGWKPENLAGKTAELGKPLYIKLRTAQKRPGQGRIVFQDGNVFQMVGYPLYATPPSKQGRRKDQGKNKGSKFDMTTQKFPASKEGVETLESGYDKGDKTMETTIPLDSKPVEGESIVIGKPLSFTNESGKYVPQKVAQSSPVGWTSQSSLSWNRNSTINQESQYLSKEWGPHTVNPDIEGRLVQRPLAGQAEQGMSQSQNTGAAEYLKGSYGHNAPFKVKADEQPITGMKAANESTDQDHGQDKNEGLESKEDYSYDNPSENRLQNENDTESNTTSSRPVPWQPGMENINPESSDELPESIQNYPAGIQRMHKQDWFGPKFKTIEQNNTEVYDFGSNEDLYNANSTRGNGSEPNEVQAPNAESFETNDANTQPAEENEVSIGSEGNETEAYPSDNPANESNPQAGNPETVNSFEVNNLEKVFPGIYNASYSDEQETEKALSGNAPAPAEKPANNYEDQSYQTAPPVVSGSNQLEQAQQDMTEDNSDAANLFQNNADAFSNQQYVPVDEFGAPLYGNETDDYFQREALETHNRYRSIHNAPPLQLNEYLSLEAQSFARILANIGATRHEIPTLLRTEDEGENVARGCSKWGGLTASGAVRRWYSQVCAYDWSKRTMQPNSKNFMQVVWKGTTEMGIGRAHGMHQGLPCTFIVARYKPGVMSAFGDGNQMNKGIFTPSYCNPDKDAVLPFSRYENGDSSHSASPPEDTPTAGYLPGARPDSSNGGVTYLPLTTWEKNIDSQDVTGFLAHQPKQSSSRFAPRLSMMGNRPADEGNQDYFGSPLENEDESQFFDPYKDRDTLRVTLDDKVYPNIEEGYKRAKLERKTRKEKHTKNAKGHKWSEHKHKKAKSDQAKISKHAEVSGKYIRNVMWI